MVVTPLHGWSDMAHGEPGSETEEMENERLQPAHWSTKREEKLYLDHRGGSNWRMRI